MSHRIRDRFHRKPLALPYNAPPAPATVRFDDTLKTAAQIVAATPHDRAAA